MQSGFFVALLFLTSSHIRHKLYQVDSSEDSKLTLHQVISITKKDNPLQSIVWSNISLLIIMQPKILI